MIKPIKIDFYRVTTPDDNNPPFEVYLDNVNSLPRDESRNLEDWHYPLRLHSSRVRGDFCEGRMIRIRMTDIPLKAALSGRLTNFNLNDDEGFGESTAFLYFKPARILLMHRHKYSVTSLSFGLYFRTKCDANGSVDLEKILRADIVDKLNRMAIFKTLEIKIADIDNAAVFQNHSLNGLLNTLRDFQSRTISVKLAMEKSGGGLRRSRVMSTIRGLIDFANESSGIERVHVHGKEDDDSSSEPLDILNATILERVNIDTGNGRTIPYSTIRRALRDAWTRRELELLRMFNVRR